MQKATVDLYLDASREKVIVGDKDGNAPGAKYVLALKGKPVSEKLVKTYGLKKYVTGAVESSDVETDEVETKAVESDDVENKAITVKSTKTKK